MHDLWKFIVVTITGLALAGAAVGIVAAQSGEDASPSPTAEDETTPSDGTDGPAPNGDKTELKDNYLDTLAGNLGVSREDLDAALRQTGLDLLDQAVADGRITEDEAAKIRERIESGEGLFPFFGHHGGFRHGFMVGAKLDDIASFLGVDLNVVTQGLQDGQSLAQIGEAHGKSRDELKGFMLSKLDERLSQAVADGTITQERADEVRSNADARIDEMIDRAGMPFPGHDLPGHRPFGPEMDDGNDNSGDATGASLTF